MKKVLGTIFLVIGCLLEGLIVFALFLAFLKLLGVMSGGADYPGFQAILIAGFVLQFLILPLLKIGFALRESSSETGISPAATLNLFFLGIVITVVAFLKTCVPYFQNGSRAAGFVALISVIAFAVLCILLVRFWNKNMK